MPALFAESALLADGWARDVRIEIGETGDVESVTPGAAPDGAERAGGMVLPGMPNLHSHAFQRAMAGLGERAGAGADANADDSFWTWRQVMYGFLARLTPADVEAIAAQLYVEMLLAGYTAVAEFHYLHHAPDGAPYDDPAEMSGRIAAAAESAGIGVTLLPVLYAAGGFGGQAPNPGQRRFLHDGDGFARLLDTLFARHRDDRQVRVGMAPHSLRAAPPEVLRDALAHLGSLDAEAPVHIHIAEQTKEVEDCVAWSGARPVEWLLANMPVDGRWCLVHATHMTETETERAAASGAVAGLCPTTEANLGDGLFPLARFLAAGGRIGVGSDSHISVSPVEELRWLEYGQRLTRQRRNIVRDAAGPSVGAALYRAALAGGAQAAGRPVGCLAPGCRADLVVLDPDHPQIAGRADDVALDSFVFSGNRNPVRHVMAGGAWLVRDGRHVRQAEIAARYLETVRKLG